MNDNIDNDIMARAIYLLCENPNKNKYDIIRQAIDELDNNEHLRDVYNLFDIDENNYIEDFVRRL